MAESKKYLDKDGLEYYTSKVKGAIDGAGTPDDVTLEKTEAGILQIKDGGVTASKLADGSVGTSAIEDGSIVAEHINDLADIRGQMGLGSTLGVLSPSFGGTGLTYRPKTENVAEFGSVSGGNITFDLSSVVDPDVYRILIVSSVSISGYTYNPTLVMPIPNDGETSYVTAHASSSGTWLKFTLTRNGSILSVKNTSRGIVGFDYAYLVP